VLRWVNGISDTLKGIEGMEFTYRRHMGTFIITATYTFERVVGKRGLIFYELEYRGFIFLIYS
jgi:hypothetical protein